MKDILVEDRYRIDRRIAGGCHGSVYTGLDIKTKKDVAIKLIHDPTQERRYFGVEAEVSKAVSSGTGMPKLWWSGHQDEYYVLVYDLLGPSLEDLFEFCGQRFNLKTVLLIADQALARLRYMHGKKCLHCDIKPDNLLMGRGKQGSLLYVTDFGSARRVRDAKRRTPLKSLFNHAHDYTSISHDSKNEHSWRDDLESLAYTLIYLHRGSLPWTDIKAEGWSERARLVKEKKSNTTVEKLCKGLPEEFAEFVHYVRSLEFNEKPNYTYLQRLFQHRFVAEGFQRDNVYHWTEKLFYDAKRRLEDSDAQQDAD